MKILDLVDFDELRYNFLVSNTTGYLFKSIYTSQSVIGLLNCKLDNLIEAIEEEHNNLEEFELYLLLLVLLVAIGRKDMEVAKPYFDHCINNNVLYVKQLYFDFRNYNTHTTILEFDFILNTNFCDNNTNDITKEEYKPKILTKSNNYESN